MLRRALFLLGAVLAFEVIFCLITYALPVTLQEIGWCKTPGSTSAESVFAQDQYAYVAFRGSVGNSGLAILSISDPGNPYVVGVHWLQLATDVFVVGSYAYVTDEAPFSAPELQVLDVSNPQEPIPVGSCDLPGNPNAIVVAGSYAYVASSRVGLQVIDVSEPTGPRLVGSCTPARDYPGYHDVFVSYPYAYVASSALDYSAVGLDIMDVSDPTNPQLVGACATPADAEGVFVSGAYAYVTDGIAGAGVYDTGLRVIDVRNPRNPVLVGSYDSNHAEGVWVSGSYAYVATSNTGLLVIDVSDSANPQLVASFSARNWAQDVFLQGSYIYAATGDAVSSGFGIYQLVGEPSHTVSTPEIPSGPESGQVGESLAFSTGGATCSQGHSVQYRFDWGDGGYSNWSSATSAFHSYSSADTYQVKAQARCASDTSVVSNWSGAKTVSIGTAPAAHTVSTPNTPSGPSSGQVAESLTFSTGGSTCSQGHAVEYQFDWGDGNYSNWSSATSASYSYPNTSTYQVRAQARCASDTSVVSNWSGAKTVNIGEAPPTHTVSTPDTPSGPSSGQVGESLAFSTGGATCSQGHPVEYRFDWEEGEPSEWSSSTSAFHSYSTAGTYQVRAQARCASNTSIVSNWSGAKTVAISEASAPAVKPVVLLVHGFHYLSNYNLAELWESMSRILVDSGLNVYVSNYAGRKKTWKDIRYYAAQLADEIDAIKTLENAEQVDIVAHSMGGLVARAYIESEDFAPYIGTDGYPDYGISYRNDVRKLVILGSPNHGASLANWARWLRVTVESLTSKAVKSVRQMEIGSDFLSILNYGSKSGESDTATKDEINTAVEYTTIAGVNCNYCYQSAGILAVPTCLSYCRKEGKQGKGNDGLVNTESVRLSNVDSYTYFVDHSGLRTVPQVCGTVSTILLTEPVYIDQAYTIAFACAVNVVVADEFGRRVSDAGVTEIPDAAVIIDSLNEVKTFYLPLGSAYTVNITANDAGSFTMIETLPLSSEETIMNVFGEVPIGSQTIATVELDPAKTSRVMRVDHDGDGTIDQERTPLVVREEEEPPPPGDITVVVGPNPVPSGGCVFWFTLPEEVGQGRLMLLSITGRLVFEVPISIGETRFPSSGKWIPVDQDGVPLANGPYVYVLIADGKAIGQGKMVIQR